MPHTQSRYQQDLGFTDGRVRIGPGDLVFTGANLAISRVAAGQWGVVLGTPAAQANTFAANLTQAIMRRTGFFEDTQQQFGPANPNSPTATAIAGSAQVRYYRPDVIPAMNTGQQLQPRSAFKAKGFKIRSIDAVYSLGVANATAHTMRVDQTVFVNNVAPAITSLLASGANGLATATQAQPYVTNVPIVTTPDQYIILPDTDVWIEEVITGAGTTTVTFYGWDVAFDFNWN
jgi:hypothetical protein